MAVTEAEWLACSDPQPMMEFLCAGRKASERKLRLFACACCRRVWGVLPKDSQKAIKVAEQFADGSAGAEELQRSRGRAEGASRGSARRWWRLRGQAGGLAEEAAWWATADGEEMATMAARCAAGIPGAAELEDYRGALRLGLMGVGEKGLYVARWRKATGERGKKRERDDEERTTRLCDEAWWTERLAQAAFVRDLFGNPFRPAPPTDPAWLAWNGGTVPKLAAAIYNDRAFDRLPVLADALEDAGCADAAILAHCRGPGPHVRGCWVVDLLLGHE